MKVTRVSSKEVTTKFGPKPTYSIQCDDGQWYSLGFKNPGISDGDEVEFDFVNNRYGNQVTLATLKIKKGDGTVAAPAPARGGFGRAEKVFPIPLLHGDRSIVRQNALTNAREVFVASHGGKPFAGTSKDVAKDIIDLAREFELYTAGDTERLNAEKTEEK